MYALYFIFIVFVIWMFNLELNPQLGHIWLRPDVTGDIVFSPINIVNLLIKPFYDLTLWNIKLWDVNFYIFLLSCTILFFIFRIISNVLNVKSVRSSKSVRVNI